MCPPLDLALPACHYDLRVSTMREEPLPVPADYAASASGTRLKCRESVMAPPHHPDLGCWQLDLTEVRKGPWQAAPCLKFHMRVYFLF